MAAMNFASAIEFMILSSRTISKWFRSKREAIIVNQNLLAWAPKCFNWFQFDLFSDIMKVIMKLKFSRVLISASLISKKSDEPFNKINKF